MSLRLWGFTEGSVTVNGGDVATLTARRLGLGGHASVDYATGGGDAVPGVDYEPLSGTVESEAPGDATVQLQTLASPGGGTVSVVVSLSNPSAGSSVPTGGHPACTVTINQP